MAALAGGDLELQRSHDEQTKEQPEDRALLAPTVSVGNKLERVANGARGTRGTEAVDCNIQRSSSRGQSADNKGVAALYCTHVIK